MRVAILSPVSSAQRTTCHWKMQRAFLLPPCWQTKLVTEEAHEPFSRDTDGDHLTRGWGKRRKCPVNLLGGFCLPVSWYLRSQKRSSTGPVCA